MELADTGCKWKQIEMMALYSICNEIVQTKDTQNAMGIEVRAQIRFIFLIIVFFIFYFCSYSA